MSSGGVENLFPDPYQNPSSFYSRPKWWRTAKGQLVSIKDMSNSHLCNALNMMKRQAEVVFASTPPDSRPSSWFHSMPPSRSMSFLALQEEAVDRNLVWVDVTDDQYFGPAPQPPITTPAEILSVMETDQQRLNRINAAAAKMMQGKSDEEIEKLVAKMSDVVHSPLPPTLKQRRYGAVPVDPKSSKSALDERGHRDVIL